MMKKKKRKTDSQLHTLKAKNPNKTKKGMQFSSVNKQTDRQTDSTQKPGGLELAISP